MIKKRSFGSLIALLNMTNHTQKREIKKFKIRASAHAAPIETRVQLYNDHIVNVEIKCTLEDRRQALMHLNDQEMHGYNSTYTYLLQNAIAKSRAEIRDKLVQDKKRTENEAYTCLDSSINVAQRIQKYERILNWLNQLHVMSAAFIPLEAFINNPFKNNPNAMPQVSIGHLQDALTIYKEKIEEALEHSDFTTYSHASILTRIQRYQDQLTFVASKKPSRAKVKHLFCVHDMDIRYVSLGRFIAEQQILLLDLALEIASFDINQQRFSEALHLPSWMRPLSDVRVELFLKAIAASGSLYNNTRSPTPSTMLGAMTSTLPLSNHGDTAKYLSVMPYAEKPLSPEMLDKVIAQAIARPYIESYSHYFTHVFIGTPFEFFIILLITGPIRVIAGAWEIAWSIVRIVLVLMMGIIDLGLSLLGWNAHQPMTKLNQYLSQLYASVLLTPLSMLRRQKHHYRDQQAFDDDYQKLLDTCQEGLGYCHQFFLLFTPEAITNWIRTFVTDLLDGLMNVYRDIRYLTFSSQAISADSIAERIQAQRRQTQSVEQESDSFPLVDYIPENKTPTFVDVVYELIDVCSMYGIEPMFRQFRIPSVVCFMGASLMFTTCIPVIVAALPSAFKALLPMKIPVQYVAHLLLNKSITDPSVAFIGCQTIWQGALATCQLLEELIAGRLKVFKPLFDEPEKYIFGFATLIAVGSLLGYLPHLPEVFFKGCPNLYFTLLNAISTETRGILNGSIAAKIITLPLVGLKGIMSTMSMAEGSKHHPSPDKTIKRIEKSSDEVLSEDILDEAQQLAVKRQQIIQLAKLVAYVKLNKHVKNDAQEDDSVCFDAKTKESYIYYNQLHRLLVEYNALLQKTNSPLALQVDYQSYLAVFFDAYCDTGCNNFIRSMYFFIPVIYLAILMLRLWKFHQAYTQDQAVYFQDLSKCFARDALFLAKLLLAVVIVLRTMFVALSCSFLLSSKLSLGLMACAVYQLYLPYRLFIELGYNAWSTTNRVETQKLSAWLKHVDRTTDRYVPYFPPSVSFFRTACNRLAEKAGSTNDIDAATDNLMMELSL